MPFTKEQWAADREKLRAKAIAGQNESDVKRTRANLSQHLISELNALDPFANVTKARLMIMRLVEMATCERADLASIREVWDRAEGKARQQVDVTHDGDVTIRSAAVSAVDELIAEATRRSGTGRSDTDPLPN